MRFTKKSIKITVPALQSFCTITEPRRRVIAKQFPESTDHGHPASGLSLHSDNFLFLMVCQIGKNAARSELALRTGNEKIDSFSQSTGIIITDKMFQ